MHKLIHTPAMSGFDSTETSDRFPHISAPIQPPQTNPPTTPSTPTDTTHTPQIPHPHSLHKHTRDAGPPTDVDVDAAASTLTPSHRETMPCPDVVAAPMQSQPRTSPQFDRPVIRQDQAIQNRTGSGRAPDRPGTRQDQIEPDQARPDQIRPSQTRPSQARSGIRQAVT